MDYIILNGKTATHGFKDRSKTKTWDEVKEFDSIGLVVPDDYVVLDFDTTSDAEIAQRIVEDTDLKCRMMKTTRGIHLWFKDTEKKIEKNFIKSRLAIGIHSDCKNGKRNSYVKIKDNGVRREWLKLIPKDEIQEVPDWLLPISTPSDKFNFKGMGDGDGRNQELFNYIVYLQTKGFKKDSVVETLSVINDYVLADPVSENELSLITRDEAFKSDEEIEEAQQRVSGFKHNEFGDELIEAFNIITVNNQIYVYEEGYYQQDERIVERKMINLYPSIKQAQRAEVLAYIKIKTHMNRADIKVNPYIINLKNTRLNIKTGDSLSFTPEVIEFDRIPVTYDPSAYCADVDKMLSKVFLGDKEVVRLFEEMMGYTLMKNNRYRSGFMFYGSGKNGKSTILNMIKAFIGKRNYTTIELDKLSDKFSTAELENKLVNIGDDINNTPLKDTGTIKKLFTGNSLLVQRKGERPFDLESYAKMIFSANEIPRSYDKTEGFYSRLMFIPFNARFTPSDDDYDPHIEDKITTDEALSYLLNLALKGAKRLMDQGGFTTPKVVEDAMTEYKTENSTVLTWIEDESIDLDQVLDNPANEVYSTFTDWCKLSGIKLNSVTGKKAFNKELRIHFGLSKELGQKRDAGNARHRYFVMDLDD